MLPTFTRTTLTSNRRGLCLTSSLNVKKINVTETEKEVVVEAQKIDDSNRNEKIK